MTTLWAPGGNSFTAASLAQMRFLARGSVTIPAVVWTARRIAVTTGDGHDQAAVARAIQAWLAAKVVFVSDPRDQEMLTRPAEALREIQAYGKVGMDCDEVATLGAALALAVGLAPVFRAYKFPGGTMYGHVFTIVPVPGGAVSLDIQTQPAHAQITSIAEYVV